MNLPKLSWGGTAVFAVTAGLAAATAADAAEAVAFVVAVALFATGVIAFGAAFVRAAARSRTDLIGIGQLFFLTGGVALKEIRDRLNWSFAVQVVVALATAIARPYSSLAAGTLVPLFGLGLSGLWVARNGSFPARPPRLR